METFSPKVFEPQLWESILILISLVACIHTHTHSTYIRCGYITLQTKALPFLRPLRYLPVPYVKLLYHMAHRELRVSATCPLNPLPGNLSAFAVWSWLPAVSVVLSQLWCLSPQPPSFHMQFWLYYDFAGSSSEIIFPDFPGLCSTKWLATSVLRRQWIEKQDKVPPPTHTQN